MESIADVLLDSLADAVVDTLMLVPFLFVTYVLLEWLEHRAGEKSQRAIERAGAAGPVVGALLGAVPQCGFSAAASTLYAGRVITLGTLFAVFLSTSDEMLPIFIAEAVPLSQILGILGTKVVIGIIAGFAVDGVLHLLRHDREPQRIHELCEHDHCHCEKLEEAERAEGAAAAHAGTTANVAVAAATCADARVAAGAAGGGAGDARGGAHGASAVAGDVRTQAHAPAAADGGHASGEGHARVHSGKAGVGTILRSAVSHTVQVTLFVFLIVLVLNLVLAAVGEDALAGFLNASPVLAVLASALVGLIPNCAASVAIAQLYVDGLLAPGAMLSGLLSAAGIGLLVLFRTNRSVKRNVQILAALWGIAVVCGLVVEALGIVF